MYPAPGTGSSPHMPASGYLRKASGQSWEGAQSAQERTEAAAAAEPGVIQAFQRTGDTGRGQQVSRHEDA